MKKVVIGLIILFLVFGSISIYYFTSKGNKESKTVLDTVIESKDDSSKKEDITNDPITKNNESDSSSDKNISNNDVSSNESNLESNNTTNSNVINKDTKQTNVEQEEVKPTNPEPAQVPKVEQHQQTEWEKVGISEYDYYNKPMWSWARIDYSIKTYGNFEQTHQACIEAGNSMEDIVSFSCTNINSYSGDYLGDMLRVKY